MYDITSPLVAVQQNKDRRYERDAKFCASTANAYMGVYGATSISSTHALLQQIAGLAVLKNYTTGIEWINVVLYTNHSTGVINVLRYYSGTTSTWATVPLTTENAIPPTSALKTYRIPIYGNELIDFGIAGTSLATRYFHIMTQEANALF